MTDRSENAHSEQATPPNHATFAAGIDTVKARRPLTTRLRRVLVIASLLTLGSLSGVAATATVADAQTTNYGSNYNVWWFFESNVPYSFGVYTSASVTYDAYYGEPGWDYVTHDGLNIDVNDGQAYWLPPTPIYVAQWLEYFQSGYNFVNTWAGQAYVNCIASVYDTYQCLQDWPDYSYWDPMHVGQDYEGWSGVGDCCTNSDWYWVM